MKSKISFFNKTIFKKNLTLYWPIWVVYTLVLLCMHPMVLWVNNYYARFYDTYSNDEKLSDLLSCLYTEPATMLITLVSVVVGLAVYNYLYHAKSANMIHALPVDRTELFFTNVISGNAMLIVPLFITALFMTALCVAYAVPGIAYIWIWFLFMSGVAFSSFAVVSFCAMFTGHTLALPAYVFILNNLTAWAYYIFYTIVSIFGYGVQNIGTDVYQLLEYFSPYRCFMSHIHIDHKYDAVGRFVGGEVRGTVILAIYVLISIALYAFAYKTYKKRHIEAAGEMITADWLKPIFRWGVATTVGVFGGVLLLELSVAIRLGVSVFGYIIAMLILGALGYFAADMLIKKSFHVFKKKNWIGCAVCLAILLVSFLGLYGVSDIYEDYVPDREEVEYARISFGYDMKFDGDGIDKIIELHEEILQYKDACEEYKYTGSWEYETVMISYTMKNGDYISRWYIIPYDYNTSSARVEGMDAIIDELISLSNNEELLLESLFSEGYKGITEFNYGWVEYPVLDRTEEGYEGHMVVSEDLTGEQAKAFYAAIMADIEAGTLLKYNTYISALSIEEPLATISIEFVVPSGYEITEDGHTYETYEDGETVYYRTAEVRFGRDCKNVIETLIKLGFIESEDEICWDY